MRMQREPNTLYMQRFVKESTEKFSAVYCREDLMEDWARMREAQGKSSYVHRKKELVDHLQACGADCTMDSGDADLRRAVEAIPARRELLGELTGELYRVYGEFPVAGDYMARMVRRWGDPAGQAHSVRTAIVMEFLKHDIYKTLAVKRLAQELYGLTPEQADDPAVLLCTVDDRIFDAYDHGMTEQEKKDTYALLRLADQLARGDFRERDTMKHDLYLFAFAFALRPVLPGVDGADADCSRDLNKHLFSRYYQDRLLKYVVELDRSDKKTADGEKKTDLRSKEPTGAGINPKNAVEMIYLYCLRQEGRTPGERYRLAKRLLNRCRDCVKKHPEYPDRLPGRTSRQYWAAAQSLWQVGETAFVARLCRMWEIPREPSEGGRMAAESEERTAFETYLELVQRVIAPSQPRHPDRAGMLAHLSPELRQDRDFLQVMRKMQQLLAVREPGDMVAAVKAWRQRKPAGCDQHLLTVCVAFQRVMGLLPGEPVTRTKLNNGQGWMWSLSGEGSLLRALAETAREAVKAEDELAKELEKLRVLRETMKDTLERWLAEQIQGEESRSALSGCLAARRGVEICRARMAERSRWTQQAEALRRTRQAELTAEIAALWTDNGVEPAPEDRISGEEAVQQLLLRMRNKRNAPRAALEELSRRLVGEHRPARAAEALLEAWRLLLAADPYARLADRLDEAADCLRFLSDNLYRMESPDFDQRAAERLPGLRQALARARREVAQWDDIRRVDLLSVLRCAYLQDQPTCGGASMPELLADFRDYADEVLLRCRYHPLDDTNLFDMYVVFSLYYEYNWAQTPEQTDNGR